MSVFDNIRKLCHGDRDDRTSCARQYRKKQEVERNAKKGPEYRAKKNSYRKEYSKSHKDKRPKEYFRKFYQLKYAVPGGLKSEKRKAAARENGKKGGRPKKNSGDIL